MTKPPDDNYRNVLGLIAAAKAAAKDGVPQDAIEADLKRRTGMGMAGLQQQSFSMLHKYEADALKTMFHGMSGGLLDELAGLGAMVVPGGKGYTQARDAMQQTLGQFSDDNKVSAAFLDVAGSAASPANVVLAGTGVAKPGATMLRTFFQRAAGLAAVGGAEGFARGDDTRDRLKKAAMGAGIGVGMAAAPIAGVAVAEYAKPFLAPAKRVAERVTGGNRAVDKAVSLIREKATKAGLKLDEDQIGELAARELEKRQLRLMKPLQGQPAPATAPSAPMSAPAAPAMTAPVSEGAAEAGAASGRIAGKGRGKVLPYYPRGGGAVLDPIAEQSAAMHRNLSGASIEHLQTQIALGEMTGADPALIKVYQTELASRIGKAAPAPGSTPFVKP